MFVNSDQNALSESSCSDCEYNLEDAGNSNSETEQGTTQTASRLYDIMAMTHNFESNGKIIKLVVPVIQNPLPPPHTDN